MSSAGISFGGMASGLDTQAIISALMAVERRPITAMEAKKTSLGRQKGLFGDLEGLLGKLKDAATALKRTTDFLAMSATSDDETVLGATAGNAASSGSWRVKVLDLAQSEIRASAGHADRNTTHYGAGTLQIDVGGTTKFVSFGNGQFDDTLDGIAAAINAQEDLDVAAEVVDTGNSDPAARFQLVVRSTITGAAGDFTLAVDTSTDPALDALLAEINGPGGTGTTSGLRTAATDAHIQVNGIDVWRSSNTVADAVPGVTLDLRSKDPANEITVTVATDGEATSKKVQDFVEAYNKVVDFMVEQNQVGADGKAKGALFGDVTLRSIRSALRGEVGNVVGTGNPAYQMLAQIGVTSDTAGKLTFNQSKFEEALAADEVAVGRIFADTTNGIAGKVLDRLEVYTDSVDGLIKARKEGFDSMTRTTQSRIDQAERRLTLYETQLKQRFANLESLLSQLQGQGSSLSGIAQRR